MSTVSLAGDKEALRRYYDENASVYDRWMRAYDPVMLGDARHRVCARARGRTLELAVGTGLNLARYPQDVDLVAVEYSSAMLDVARERALHAGRRATFAVEDAHMLGFKSDTFDTVVATLFLSSVTDPASVTAEAHRVLRPGGTLLVLDHVRSPLGPLAWLQRVTEPFVAARTGVHLSRDPLDYLAGVGFVVEYQERSRLGVIQELVARKPQSPARAHTKPRRPARSVPEG